jgi:hypothetical protein
MDDGSTMMLEAEQMMVAIGDKKRRDELNPASCG